MDRKWKSGAAVGAPALTNASDGFPTNGNPGGGVPATVPGDHWYYMVTEELLALVADAGIAFDKTVVTQVRDAVRFLVANAALPRSYLTGYGFANGGDAVNDIDIAAGMARSSDDTMNLVGGAMTKQLDAVWAAGTNAGGRISSESIANGTWHVFAFKRTTGGAGIDYCYSQSLAPTFPDSGVKGRRIGSILREAGSIVAFFQYGDEFYRMTPVQDVNATNPGTAAVTRTLSVPTGIKVKAKGMINVSIGTSGSTAYISPLDLTDVAAAAGGAGTFTSAGASSNSVGGQYECWTNTSGQVRSRLSSSDGSTILQLGTLGWIDRRDRDK